MHSVITGGAGFIGSHLTDFLLNCGDSVAVIDDFSTGRQENLLNAMSNPRFQLIEGSVLDRNLVLDTVVPADRVFHLAAAVGVRRIIEQPLESLRVNLHGTENVLEAARRRARCDGAGLHQRDVRHEHRRRTVRGRRPHPGRSAGRQVDLRGGQGHRRSLRARLLARARVGGVDRAVVQHRGAAPDRPLRHGGAQPGRPGVARRGADGVR